LGLNWIRVFDLERQREGEKSRQVWGAVGFEIGVSMGWALAGLVL